MLPSPLPSSPSYHCKMTVVVRLLIFSVSIFSSMTVDQELPLGLQPQPKQHSSPRAEVLPGSKQVKADMNKELNNSEKIPMTLEQTVLDENSRMLLDIDITHT